MSKINIYFEITKVYLLAIYSYITLPLTFILTVILSLFYVFTIKFNKYKNFDGSIDFVSFVTEAKVWLLKNINDLRHHFNIIIFLIILYFYIF